MKIKLLLLIPILFLTGCSVNYNLRIDSSLKVKETITVLEQNDILKIHNDNLKLVPDQVFSQYSYVDNFKNYKLKDKLFKNDKTGGIVENTYKSINNYKNSFFFSTLFSDINYTEYANVVSVQILGYNPSVFNSEVDPNYYMEDIVVKIKFHNKVIESNAKEYDEKTNTYTWVLNDDKQSGNISFSIDKNKKKYDIIIKDFFSDNLATIIIISVLVSIIIIVSSYLYTTYKKNDKI